MEPLVDFQLSNANIRMSFTVRKQGIVYELYVNGKRFEDLTQALPSPVRCYAWHPRARYRRRGDPKSRSHPPAASTNQIASCAEGSGMTFGEPLMFQRLGLLPPHLQEQEQQHQQAAQQQQQQQVALHQRQLSAASHHRQLSLLGSLDGSISSLAQPIVHDGLGPLLDDSQTSTVSAGIVATLAFQHQQNQQHQNHHRQISLTHHQDVFSVLAVPPINVATTVTFGSTPTTAAATTGTPTTTVSSDASAWADGMAVAEARKSLCAKALGVAYDHG